MSNDYRKRLVAAELKSQDDYDKTIISLSSGALGLSVLFIKEIVQDSTPSSIWSLIASWSTWAVSITAVVVSYFLSRLALRRAISQVDDNDFSGGVGGWASKATEFFNIMSGTAFILGIVFFIIFSVKNL